ncbi:MAG TPA: pyruvate dehydrogenase (acetyl-transferring), homodimeric type [Bryobacteraceae bacterium]|jgi:pyruvate dehydrogenase E1 component|nr:pyruvate dehydrogenase (acetyl-transferring), homodimeric type [Bryobacteraceae bacterium]
MHLQRTERTTDLDPRQTAEWLEALDQIVDEMGPDRVNFILDKLAERARENGVDVPVRATTDYINTISPDQEVTYPGDWPTERRLKSLMRWNAMTMVSHQNKDDDGIGGHIATYASLATLLEVGFNHFFRGSYGDQPGDFIYFQGHASPGVYARAFLEGRLTEAQLKNFRHELRGAPGLSSYPHPWLMKDFWQFPTVSMGLGPINSIYQAKFMRYLENRGMIEPTPRKIWAFLGDGEMDEPESTGAITVATRERLDNLIFVINCNLQRLDGPVRGNGKVIQELEGLFAGAGWNVVKCIWGCDWDRLLAKDTSGRLVQLMNECIDGEYQAFKAKGGAYTRQEFFGRYPETARLVEDMTDDEIADMHRGGHDPKKVYNAYKAAMDHKGGPTVVLAKTVKGYGMGTGGEARNAAHQQKKMKDDQVGAFLSRFKLSIPSEIVTSGAMYRPDESSPEIVYLHERRKALGGYLPVRKPAPSKTKAPSADLIEEFKAGSKEPHPSSTMAFVRLLAKLMKTPEFGKKIVPIIPDEARTFGMEAMFRNYGIYAAAGQLYKPHDSDQLLYYKEAKDGQMLEEGITEAGSIAEFTAAGTAYANYGVDAIPFYIYYSMFGFQRVGDAIWAFADSRGKGFLLGATAGRTTLSGEGLQHQDGHSLLLASTVPTIAAYDPCFAFEIAVIVRDGIRRMYEEREDLFYYLTLYNENYPQLAMPEGCEEGILKGIYLLKKSDLSKAKARVQLLGSGSILTEALKAQQILADKYSIAADLWSVTSYSELRRQALKIERWNRLHPAEPAQKPYIQQVLENTEGPVIAASDYMKTVQDQIAPWLPGRYLSLGTDGFGRSDNREHLRAHFEVNAASIAGAAISKLARDGKFEPKKAAKALADLGIDPEKADAATA